MIFHMFFFQSLVSLICNLFHRILNALCNCIMRICSAESRQFHFIICSTCQKQCNLVRMKYMDFPPLCLDLAAFSKNFDLRFCPKPIVCQSISQRDRISIYKIRFCRSRHAAFQMNSEAKLSFLVCCQMNGQHIRRITVKVLSCIMHSLKLIIDFCNSCPQI